MAAPVPRVELGQLVRRVCFSVYDDLEKLSVKLTNLDSDTRKRLLQVFFKNVRHRLIKLLAVVKWCARSGQLVNDMLALVQDYASNEVRIFEAIGGLRKSASTLRVARAPAYDIANAVDILSTGTYLKLPRIIAQLSGNASLDGRLPEMDEEETLRKLEQYILDRLLLRGVPSQFSSLKVADGTLTCTVEHEFEVVLTLSGASLDSPWCVLKVSILVEGQSTSLERASKQRHLSRRPGVEVYLDYDPVVDEETEQLEEQADETDQDLSPTNVNVGETDMDTDSEGNNRKRKRQTYARDASSAFRPKKSAVFYLLKVLQQVLLNSTDPLKDMYEMMHKFCASLCVRTLEAQARELTENHWKAGVLFVNSPRPNVLELKHWGDTCILRISFDPKQRQGQLFVELEPPIDTASCRSAVSMALTKSPPTQRRRNLVVLNTMQEMEVETGMDSEKEKPDTMFVDGLCPSMLNVEKVLLLGALAHAEGRLNQLGVALDELLFELETGSPSSKLKAEIPAWAPSFKPSIGIVTDDDQVALHVDLPVQRYLRVTVEMRTGDFILTLVRKSAKTVQVSSDCHQTSRRWGSSSDLLLLSTSEKALNSALKQEKIPGAAKVLVKLLFLLSMHSIMESFELAAEVEQMAYQRSYPFVPVTSQTNDQQQQQQMLQQIDPSKPSVSTPCLFIRLNSWDGYEYFVGMCGKGLVPKLYDGVPFFTQDDQATSEHQEQVESALTSQIDWFVVAGPFDRELASSAQQIMLGKPFENISENFSSDATVRAMLGQVLREAHRKAMRMRVAKFIKHFRADVSRGTLPSGEKFIEVDMAPEMSGLISGAFANPRIRVTFLLDALGFDVTLFRNGQDGRVLHKLPLGSTKPDFDLIFALTGTLKYNTDGLYLQYRSESDDTPETFDLQTACGGAAGPPGSGAVFGLQNGSSQPHVPPPRLSKASYLSGFSDLPSLNMDLVSVAKMEILCQSLLESRKPGTDDTIELNNDPGAPDLSMPVRILYASHVCVMVECRNGDVTLVAAIGIDPSPTRKFIMRILSIQKDTPGKLPLPEDLPWANETLKLLNTYIPSDLKQVDWAFMKTVLRQVLASLTFALPCFPALNDILNPQPDCVLNEHKSSQEKKGGLPQLAGRGKGMLSASIQKQKESAGKGARGVTVIALSHLRIRVLVGETRKLDLLFSLHGITVDTGNAQETKTIVQSNTVVPYVQFPDVFQKCIKAMLDE